MILFYFLVLLLFGGLFVYIGLRALISKKAFVFDGLYLCITLSILFSLQSIFLPLMRNKNLTTMNLVNFIIFIFLVYIFWKSFKGIIILGANTENLKNAFTSIYSQNQSLTYKETLGGIETPDGAQFRVGVNGSIGSAHIQAKNEVAKLDAPKLLLKLKSYYKNNSYSISNFSFYIYLAMGVVLIFLAFFLLSLLFM